MTLIQWLRDKFHLDPHLSREQLCSEFLRAASKTAKKGKIVIYKGGYKTLEQAMFDPENHVFILAIQGKKFKKPRELMEWFRDFKV